MVQREYLPVQCVQLFVIYLIYLGYREYFIGMVCKTSQSFSYNERYKH